MASVSEAQRDFNLLRHIARYCDDAIDAARQAGSEAVFVESRLYQHAVAMCVLEIGELSKHLSEDFLRTHAEMPWRHLPDEGYVRASLSPNRPASAVDDGYDGFARAEGFLR